MSGGFVMANHGKRAPLARMSPGDGVFIYSPTTTFPHGVPLRAITIVGEVTGDAPEPSDVIAGGFRREAALREIEPLALERIREHLPVSRIRFGFFELAPTDADAIWTLVDGPATTTHDWSSAVDHDHLADVRARAGELAQGGVGHLVVEALAYPADEAAATGAGSCEVTFLADGSVRIVDDGRGTATVVDAVGRPVRKPVMATRDVRFFDSEDPPLLPDGRPCRGMSVVAALSVRLEHTNRRAEGAWTQHYDRGAPRSELVPVPADGSTGTTVRFWPDARLLAPSAPIDAELIGRCAEAWPNLSIRVVDQRR